MNDPHSLIAVFESSSFVLLLEDRFVEESFDCERLDVLDKSFTSFTSSIPLFVFEWIGCFLVDA